MICTSSLSDAYRAVAGSPAHNDDLIRHAGRDGRQYLPDAFLQGRKSSRC
jgi:hypothetical protein